MPVQAAAAIAAAATPYVIRGVVGTASSFVKDAAKSLVSGPGTVSALRRGGRIGGGHISSGVRRAATAIRKGIDDHAFAADAAANMLARIRAAGNAWFGTFGHVISVSVQGGPQASLRRVWYLTLSAAFGRLRNRVAGVQACNIDAEWDVTGKACVVTIGYSNSGIAGGSQAFFGKTMSSPLGPFQRGPDQITVGGSWPSFLTAFNINTATQGAIANVVGGALNVLGLGSLVGPLTQAVATNTGIKLQTAPTAGSVPQPIFATVFDLTDSVLPDRLIKFLQSYNRPTKNLFIELPTVNAGGEFLPWARVLPLGITVSGPYGSYRNSNGSLIPILPDDGRVITTGQKNDPRVQNPRPPIDGKTRGSLVSLVAQALSVPGVLPASPPPGYVPLHGPGVYIYDPGLGLENMSATSRGQFTTAAENADLSLPGTVPSPITPADAGFGPDGYPIQQVIPNVRE